MVPPGWGLREAGSKFTAECFGINACGDGGSRTRQREKLGCWVASTRTSAVAQRTLKLEWPSGLGPEGWASDASTHQSLEVTDLDRQLFSAEGNSQRELRARSIPRSWGNESFSLEAGICVVQNNDSPSSLAHLPFRQNFLHVGTQPMRLWGWRLNVM